MGYQDKQSEPIRHAAIENMPATEPQMRSFAATIFAPAFALAALGVLAVVPTPRDIYFAIKPIGTELTDVAGGVRDGREDITTLASRIETAAGDSLGTNADCFEDLGLAVASKLDRCGKFVYQVLAEVEQNPQVFTADAAYPTTRKALVQELRLAATEVCRERWSRTGVIPKDSPACAVSLAALETRNE